MHWEYEYQPCKCLKKPKRPKCSRKCPLSLKEVCKDTRKEDDDEEQKNRMQPFRKNPPCSPRCLNEMTQCTNALKSVYIKPYPETPYPVIMLAPRNARISKKTARDIIVAHFFKRHIFRSRSSTLACRPKENSPE
jgi:hypothetical protein